jgi:hypothetical protein
MFALGLSSLLTFEFVGTVFALDILIAVISVWILFRSKDTIFSNLIIPFLVLLAFWLIGAVVTDSARHTELANVVRGWSKIIVFTLSFFALAKLSGGRPARLAAFLLGMAAATCMATLLFPSLFQEELPWKFGYATPLSLLAVVGASIRLNGRPPSIVRQVSLPLILAAVNLALNFRSLFAILVAVAGVTALVHLARILFPGRRIMGVATGMATITLFVLGGWGVSQGYSQLAASGVLGQDALAKHQMQTQGDLGLLLGGRTESLASVQAIKDSPLLGHGSWAENRYYAELLLLELERSGRAPQGGVVTSALIPSHSYFFGAWVESGIAGALFWLVAFVTSVVALLRLIDLRSTWTPFLAFCCIQLIWNIPFSPFAAEGRFMVAAQLLVALLVIEATRKSRGFLVRPRKNARRMMYARQIPR